MESLLHDLRYGVRFLARSKGFAAIAIVSLGLTLGLNTTTYAILDAFTHPWVPYRDPERIVKVAPWGDPREERISRAERDGMLKSLLRNFSDSIGFAKSSGTHVVSAGAYSAEVYVQDISPNYFTVVGVVPEMGRIVQPRNDENLVAVGHDFWVRNLGATSDLRGASITMDGQSHNVIAVVPTDHNRQWHPQVWRVRPASEFRTGMFGAAVFARLKTGTSITEVQTAFNDLAKVLETRPGPVRGPFSYRVETLQPDPYNLSDFHLGLAASALVLLVIACANLANLMSARGVARRRELALRLAIGASRGALIRQLLAEAVVLAAIGGALGLLAAAWGVGLLKGGMPQMDFLALRAPRLSWRFFAFGALGSGLTVILFGLVPAIRASDVDVAEPLKEGAGTHTGRVHRYSALAISQVALALLLVMAATVLVTSAYRLAKTDFGFEPRGLNQVWVSLDPAHYPDAAAVERGFRHVLDGARAIPGVRSVATANIYAQPDQRIVLSDFVGDTVSMMMLPSYAVVSESFLRTLGIPIVAGRDFEPGDRGAAVVNDAAARALWHGQNPVGRMLKLGSARSKAPWIKVVGVAAPAICCDNLEPDLPDPPQVYVVPFQHDLRNKALVFRVAANDHTTPARIALGIRGITGSTMSMPVAPWFQTSANRVAALRFATGVFAFIGVCGLGLAAVGLYGVLAYTVNRRTREFGVRMALGATRSNVFRMVLHDGAVMCVAGTAIGACIALVLASYLESRYESPPADLVSLVLATCILSGVALAACLVPARRATRADPVEILRAT